MKAVLFMLTLILLQTTHVKAQSDTLFLKGGQTVVAKINKETEIQYFFIYQNEKNEAVKSSLLKILVDSMHKTPAPVVVKKIKKETVQHLNELTHETA